MTPIANMGFEEATATKAVLENIVRQYELLLSQYAKLSTGYPFWQDVRDAYNDAFKVLHDFDRFYLKQFAKEWRSMKEVRRAAKITYAKE